MRTIRTLAILLLLFICSTSLLGQTKPTATPVTSGTENREAHRGDIPDLTRETQLGVRAPGYTGLIWWIPNEFWTQSAIKRGGNPEKTAEAFRPLRDYTIVYVFVAKVSDLGVFEFVPPEQLQKKVFLRDSSGVEYPALDNVSDAAKNLAGMLKPMLSNAMGKAGDNLVMLFFPAKTKDGISIADPLVKGSFSVTLKDIVGVPQDSYEWRLPLTSLSPDKFCPYGKERVNANWNYCPWHGVALNNSVSTTAGK